MKKNATSTQHGKLQRNDPCWCGSGKKYKKCHLAADRKKADAGEKSVSRVDRIERSSEYIEGMRKSVSAGSGHLEHGG